MSSPASHSPSPSAAVALRHAVLHHAARLDQPLAAISARWLYRPIYRSVIVLAALDVLCTSIILTLGGTEVNALACWLFRHTGPLGLAALKIACLALVIAICQKLGRSRLELGRRIAIFAMVANGFAVTIGLVCLANFAAALY